MTEREELFHLVTHSNNPAWRWFPNNAEMLHFVDYLLANGVTVQKWIPVAEQGAKPMTNGEYIRSMSDEQLAEYIGQHTLCDRIQDEGDWCDKRAVCRDCLTDWLQQPAKEEA